MIDAHAHLTDERFAGDVDAVIARAAAAGVERILTCGEDVASSEAAVEIARTHASVRAAAGIHPHRAQSCDAQALAALRRLAAAPSVVAIGEIGLDLSGRSGAPAEQERAFAAQVGLAAELGLPVVVHVREAGDAVRSLLDRSPAVRGQIHCYSETAAEVEGWVGRGFYISFAGTVTFPRNDALREAARAVPLDRLLVETDAPYLAPQNVRGRRNEPAYVAATVDAVARARGAAGEEIAAATSRNAAALFGAAW